MATDPRMPRKPLIYTSEFPYHVYARSNNKEWFYLPISECWNIFATHLNELTKKKLLQVHTFVLMDNHYHLIATAPSQNLNLGHAMCWLQRETARTINRRTGRINHIFGGSYKACLIQNEFHYAHVLKYVLRNPVEAGVCERVEQYQFSTLQKNTALTEIKVIDPQNGIQLAVPGTASYISWLNRTYDKNTKGIIKKALSKTEFKLCTPDRTAPHPLNSTLL